MHNAEEYKCSGFSERAPLHWIGENRAEGGGAPILHGVQKVSCLEYLPNGQPLSIMLQERRKGQQANIQFR